MYQSEDYPPKEQAAMSNQTNITESERLLYRLARTAAVPAENSFVTSPGDRTVTAAAKVISNNSYNLCNKYNSGSTWSCINYNNGRNFNDLYWVFINRS